MANEGTPPPSVGLPTATCARTEIPDLTYVREAGLELALDEARLILVVLSQFIARGRSKTRDKVGQMRAGLIACCLVDTVRDGQPILPARPGLARFGWPAGDTALRRLGIASTDIERYWRTACTRNTDASLPLRWALAFMPAALWPAVLSVISWGPEEAGMRLKEAMILAARLPVHTERRNREQGATLSRGTLETRVNGMQQLFDVLVELRSRALASPNPGLPLALLVLWTAKPARPDLGLCGAVEARIDTSGPPLEKIRALLHTLDDEIYDKGPCYLRLRKRLIAALLACHGPRIDALRTLDVADYLPHADFGDGTGGPGLVYRAPTTRKAGEGQTLYLPEELATWIEQWIEFTGRRIGQEGTPMWPSAKPKPGKLLTRISASGLERSISGQDLKDGRGALALLSRNGNRYEGYNPHSFRHTAYQLAKRAGTRARSLNPDVKGQITPDDFARALVGHDLVRNVGDRYRDLNRAELARIAIEHVWQEIRHRGTNTDRDPQRFADATTAA